MRSLGLAGGTKVIIVTHGAFVATAKIDCNSERRKKNYSYRSPTTGKARQLSQLWPKWKGKIRERREKRREEKRERERERERREEKQILTAHLNARRVCWHTREVGVVRVLSCMPCASRVF